MVDSHCPYCALQCAMTLTPTPFEAPSSRLRERGVTSAHPDDRGTPLTVAGREFPTNQGGLCRKGWTSAELITAPDRLTTPLVRGGDGQLHECDWDEALDLIASRLGDLAAEHGPHAVAVFGGGGLTNEKAYQLGKFARIALRTKNIDYNGRFCMASAAAAANRSLGLDRGLPFPVTDLDHASAVLLLGSNVAETMPPFVPHLTGARDAGGLIVVDPRRSATAALTAEGRGQHLQPVPGTDLVVLQALLHVVVAEQLHDERYLVDRTSGWEDVVRSVAAWWPERAEQACGIPADDLRRAARLLATGSPSRGGAGAYVLTGRGVEQSSQGTATVTAAINLALALGLVGREGSGYGALTGQGNGQGGREHGQKADQLPGYRLITDPAARAHVASVWGVDADDLPGPGLPAVALLQALGTKGGPRALLVHGANPVVSAPRSGAVVERLKELDLLVVCDIVPSETVDLADVVLPVTQWAEEEGTLTNLEGRIIRRRTAVEAPGAVRSELWVWAQLADRLGAPGTWSTDPAEVFDELARASTGGRADYSGLSHARLDAEPDLHWPCPASHDPSVPHPGTPRVFLDRFPTADGRARLIAVDHVGPAEDLRADAPLFLITGRVLEHYQSGAQTRRVPALLAAQPTPFVEVHPLLAHRLGVEDGEEVVLTTARASVTAGVRITDRVRPDTVFMPFHFSGEGSVNRVTNDAVDPISSMPEFKVCAVRVTPARTDTDAPPEATT